MALQDILDFQEILETETPRDDMRHMQQAARPEGMPMPMPPPDGPPGPAGPPMGPAGPPMGPAGPPMGPAGPPGGLSSIPPIGGGVPTVHQTLFSTPVATIATEVVKNRYLASRPDNEETYGDVINRQPQPRFGGIQLEAARGGLVDLPASNKFAGRVPGDGHGMEDDVSMAIEDGGNTVGELRVSTKEYIIPADVMSLIGNGNPDRGADIMDQIIKEIRAEATGNDEQPEEIDGLELVRSLLDKA